MTPKNHLHELFSLLKHVLNLSCFLFFPIFFSFFFFGLMCESGPFSLTAHFNMESTSYCMGREFGLSQRCLCLDLGFGTLKVLSFNLSSVLILLLVVEG